MQKIIQAKAQPQRTQDVSERSAKRNLNVRGVSLIAVILTLMFFAIFGYAALSMLSSTTQRSSDYLDSEKAFHIAEAGFQVALRLVKEQWDWTGGTWKSGFNFSAVRAGSVGGGTFSLSSVTPVSNRSVSVTSTGLYNQAQRKTSALIEKSPGALDVALYTNSDIEVGGNARINGEIMQTNPNATIEIQKPENVPGKQWYDTHGFIPTIDMERVKSNAENAGLYFPNGIGPSQSKSLDGKTGCIYSEKDAKITGGTIGTTNNPVFLVVKGNLTLEGNIVITGLIYAKGEVTIVKGKLRSQPSFTGGNATVKGEIISGNINEFSGSFSLSYHPCVQQFISYITNDPSSTTVTTSNWKEVY